MKKQMIIPNVLIIILIVAGFLTNFLEYADLRVTDFLYQHKREMNNEVIIVGIDEESLEQFGKWPWNRKIIAEAIQTLSQGEPAAIGVDIIYSELSKDRMEDSVLVKAAENCKNLVFPSYFLFRDEVVEGDMLPIDKLVFPFDELRKKSDSAIINVMPDNDGILRRAFLSIKYKEDVYESFSYNLYCKYCDSLGIEALALSDIPRDDYGRIWIDYAAKPHALVGEEDSALGGGFEHISIASVLNGEIPPEYFYNKIVLIGITSIGAPDDYYLTSIAPNSPMYGLEVHSNVIDQLIGGKFYQFLPNLVQVSILCFIGILMLFAGKYIKPVYYSLFTIGISLLLTFITYLLFKQGILISFIYYIVLIGLEYLLALFYRLITINRDKRRVQKIFGRYVEAKVVEELINTDIEDLTLGGQTLRITVLFVDIRNFTTLSEGLNPETVVGILNEYLEVCSNAILKYNGTLDKYIGDCAMAIYNAPIVVENHELAAIRSAIEMIQRADELNKRLEDKFGVSIEYGVGINVGMAVVGNIGSEFRMDYTAIGDTVNTASRLQGKADGRQILISDEVYKAVSEKVNVEFVGEMSVKGKNDLIKAYHVLGVKEE